MLWIVESTMIHALPLSQNGVVENGAMIDSLLLITLFSGATLAGLLFLGSFLRVSLVGTRQRRSGGLVLFIAIALGVAAVDFIEKVAIEDPRVIERIQLRDDRRCGQFAADCAGAPS